MEFVDYSQETSRYDQISDIGNIMVIPSNDRDLIWNCFRSAGVFKGSVTKPQILGPVGSANKLLVANSTDNKTIIVPI